MTDTQPTLAAYLTAARQISEVTGEDLLVPPDYRVVADKMFVWAPNHAVYVVTVDSVAISILRDRVWGAVRGNQLACWQGDGHGEGIYLYGRSTEGDHYPDLPSAVAAIHKHWKQST